MRSPDKFASDSLGHFFFFFSWCTTYSVWVFFFKWCKLVFVDPPYIRDIWSINHS